MYEIGYEQSSAAVQKYQCLISTIVVFSGSHWRVIHRENAKNNAIFVLTDILRKVNFFREAA